MRAGVWGGDRGNLVWRLVVLGEVKVTWFLLGVFECCGVSGLGVVGRDCGGVGGMGVGGKVVGEWAWARRAILGCEEEADGIGVVGRE